MPTSTRQLSPLRVLGGEIQIAGFSTALPGPIFLSTRLGGGEILADEELPVIGEKIFRFRNGRRPELSR